jgi:type VI secretion system secreted protein Hcp
MRNAWKAAALLAVGAAGGGAALAVASVPDSNGVIHACYSIDSNGAPVATVGQPNLRIIDPSQGQQCDNTTGSDGQRPQEAAVSWNRFGPRGPQGPPGKSVTVVGGNTLTLPGGGVVTVGSSKAVTISTPPLTTNSKAIGTVSLNLGRSSLSFNLYSWSLPGAHSSGGGGGTGRVANKEFVITKSLDKASPKLFKYCATGKHIVNATITLRKAGKPQQEYLKITLDDVLISSVQTSSSKGTEQPTESLSLNFTKVEYKYAK